MKSVDWKVLAMILGLAGVTCFFSPVANANLKELKAYKEAFPDATVKCTTCHAVAVPKKGFAELNDYGKAALAATPDAETFKRLGKSEDFGK